MPTGDNTRKLTAEETAYIKECCGKGVCKSALARKFGISRQRVGQIAASCQPSAESLERVGFLG